MNSASAMETKLKNLNIWKHLACNKEAIKELTKNEKKYCAVVDIEGTFIYDCINFYALNKKEAIEYLKDLYRHVGLQDREIIELEEVK
jgi:hypothetical protein|tara:strand:+ start:4009 stop:4272 length:264 start_codon:yes stop_codon:yes gene_type:complete